MKVLIATGIYPPEIGGPATYTHMLVEHLPAEGVEVSLLMFREVRHFPKGIRHILYFFKALSRGRSADVIFAQDPVSVGLPTVLASIILRRKFFLRLGGDYAWEQARGRFSIKETPDEFVSAKTFVSPVVSVFRFVQTFVAKRARKIIVPSKYLAGIVAKWGIPEEKIAVVYNAFDIPSLSDARASLKRELGMQDQAIVSAGRLVKWKGFEVLVNIMPQISQSFVDAHLYIIGEGPEQVALERAVQQNKMRDRVTFLGALPHEILLRYLKAADVFVLNTGYEGFSHQILEAMAVGTPIVTTDIPGNRELITHKVTGTLVPFDNKEELSFAIRDALSVGREIEGMVARAKDKAGTFTVSRMIDDTLKVIRDNV